MRALITRWLARFRTPDYILWCDGSTGPQGCAWGAVLEPREGKVVCLGGRLPPDTSNRTEIRAALASLARLPTASRVTLVSDSRVVIDALNGDLRRWRRNSWRNRRGEPLADAALWEQLWQQCAVMRGVQGRWVSRSANGPNRQAHRLATKWRLRQGRRGQQVP